MDAAYIEETAAYPLLGRLLETAEEIVDRDLVDAEAEMYVLVERVRSGEWSRAELAAMAPEIARAFAGADRLVKKATRKYEAALNKGRGNVDTTREVLHEYVQLRRRLRELAQAVLEEAERATYMQ